MDRVRRAPRARGRSQHPHRTSARATTARRHVPRLTGVADLVNGRGRSGNWPGPPIRPQPEIRNPLLRSGAALLGPAADPGGEQVTKADHPDYLASLHDGQVTEAVQEHHLGRVFQGGIRPG